MNAAVEIHADAKPLLRFILKAEDGHQLNYIFKRIETQRGLSDGDRAVLTEAWRKRFTDLNPNPITKQKPRWIQNTII